MPRRQKLLLTGLAFCSAIALSACHQDQQQPMKKAPASKPVKQVMPIHHTYHRSTVHHTQPVALKAPHGAYILVVDAKHARLGSKEDHLLTLSIPLDNLTQVAQLDMGYEAAPKYYNGHLARTAWLNTPSNTFSGSHAILSSAFLKPHSVKILSEHVENGKLIFQLHSYKPLHFAHHLSQVVFNISGDK